ncbi:MAG TPA: hypothetical protein VJH68_03945 [Candidatus Nanoarchaeia archaeon]|nr:hypothetical protein [Candidatus Nanoarchaeia archaeon]
MVNILFGDNEESTNLLLSKRLQPEHEVMYLTDAVSLLWELSPAQKYFSGRKYDLVIYDFDLFHQDAGLDRRIGLLEDQVAGYLALADAPIIIIAEGTLETKIKPICQKIGFNYLSRPYSLELALKLMRESLFNKCCWP